MGTAAFQHEAERALRMAVGRRHLAGQYELHPGVKIGGDFRLPAQAGIFEHEHAPLGLFGGDQAAGFEDGLADRRKAPMRRAAMAAWRWCDEIGQ
ncbi:hypothetical protein D9M72_540850 [compost metagenome]